MTLRIDIVDAPLFANCSRRAKDLVKSLSSQVGVPAGEVLAAEHAAGREFGVILEGVASVHVGERRVAELGPGDFWGEIALLNAVGGAGRRVARVVAETDMVIEVMSAAEFRSILAEVPEAAAEIRRVAEARVAANQAQSV